MILVLFTLKQLPNFLVQHLSELHLIPKLALIHAATRMYVSLSKFLQLKIIINEQYT